jgi:hypothetical protein
VEIAAFVDEQAWLRRTATSQALTDKGATMDRDMTDEPLMKRIA